MATIGQQLLIPEAGWKRYDDRDTNISYIGTWTPSAVTGYYNNTNMDSNSTSSYYEFWFKGTKLRIIDGLASNRSADVKVTIDGVTESYSAYATTTTRGVLVYEKTGLTNGFHKVVVKNNTSNYMTLDAIDIDEDGVFRPSYNKFLILSNNETYTIKKGEEVSAIPFMTSNTMPSGKVTASSEYSSTLTPYKAFDGDTGSRWASLNGNLGWIQYEFENREKIIRYTVDSFRNAGIANAPKDWTFEGSNDGVSFDVLDRRVGITNWVQNQPMSFDINNNKEYKIYRLNATAVNNTTNIYVSIFELKMFKFNNQEIKVIPNNSEQNFINNGMNKSTEIDLNSQIIKKVFIEQSPTTLGSGKVFSKSIDTTKTPIKKVTIK